LRIKLFLILTIEALKKIKDSNNQKSSFQKEDFFVSNDKNNMSKQIDFQNVPQHIAIIMDGNRRWAQGHNLSVSEGHKAGAKNLEKVIKYCRKIGIKRVTVYALSTENWRFRSPQEVKGLFNLLLDIVKNKTHEFQQSGVKLFVLGNISAFPQKIKNAIKKLLKKTILKEEISVNIALNYGGRDEIVNAVKLIVKDKIPANKINEKLISRYLYTKEQPDPELIIRPGGEYRISNFLIWQTSYSEFYFSDTLWPDFDEKEMKKAILWYQQRQRRFGK
jgi:undecaprenyl diphosphate synthase